MTMLVKEQNEYGGAFRALLAQRGATDPAWLRRLRQSAFETFERLGFPTVAEEEWKYTNVAPVARTSFRPVLAGMGAEPGATDRLSSFTYNEARHSRLVLVNGIFQPEASSISALPAGVVAMDIGEALRSGQHEAGIRERLTRSAAHDENGFTALNAALFSSGLFLLIPRGTSIDSPIHLVFVSKAGNGVGAPASFPRLLVIAEEASRATLIESFVSANGGVCLTNVVAETVLGPSAHLQHYRVQREGREAFHIATSKAELGPNASYETTTINLGAALSRHNIGVSMEDEGAECRVDGLYMVDSSQHTDTHSLIDHRQPRCTSRQLYKGILDGKSRAVFNGKVFVRHGAQQTDAQQTNKNLLLSNEARVDTKPQLEIFADDVKCAHGAAVGQLDEDQLFYLSTRGINPALARNILTYGFAGEVIEKIKIESIKRELDEAVLNRLHSNLEVC